MTSADTQALIEEARRWHQPLTVQTGTKTHGGPNEYDDRCAFCRGTWPCGTSRLADALEASEAELSRLRSAVAGVEALADRYDALSLIAPSNVTMSHRQAAQEIRFAISDTKGDAK